MTSRRQRLTLRCVRVDEALETHHWRGGECAYGHHPFHVYTDVKRDEERYSKAGDALSLNSLALFRWRHDCVCNCAGSGNK